MIRPVLGSRASIGGPLGSGRGGAAAWYLAGGTIAAANVAEWVENPSTGQLYAGGAITGAWTIAAYTAYPAIGPSYIFDSQTDRTILGYSDPSGYGFYAGGWANVALFSDTNLRVYFLISTGSSIQAYRDNTAIGSGRSSTNDITRSGVARWRSAYDAPTSAPWENDVLRGAIYKIALDSTQRAALYSSMTAA